MKVRKVQESNLRQLSNNNNVSRSLHDALTIIQDGTNGICYYSEIRIMAID